MFDDPFLPYDQNASVPSLFVVSSMFPDPLPSVPTMIATRLQLELLLQDSPIDLGAVSEVILADPGATLQILRLIGEEYPNPEDRPTRMEDCLASLNMQHCYHVVCASTLPQNSGLLAEWQRIRRVAHCARELARCIDGFSPEEAYIVGLLHQVGKFPHLLGWDPSGESSHEQDALGLMLADCWQLPEYLLTAIREQRESITSSRWGDFLQMAQRVAEQDETLFNS